MIFALATQFHAYQPGGSPSRDLLCDWEFSNSTKALPALFFTLMCAIFHFKHNYRDQRYLTFVYCKFLIFFVLMNLIADKEFKMVKRFRNINNKTYVSRQYHCLGSEMRIIDNIDIQSPVAFECIQCLFFKLD